jgi:excisionase family DNA binding protein
MATIAYAQKRMLRISEVARRLDCSTSTVRRLIANGQLPATQFARPGSLVRLVVVSAAIASGKEPVRILHDEEDDGFTIFDAAIVVERPELYSVDDFTPVCERCLLERHPGLGRGMDLAREWGEAQLVEGNWEPA